MMFQFIAGAVFGALAVLFIRLMAYLIAEDRDKALHKREQ